MNCLNPNQLKFFAKNLTSKWQRCFSEVWWYNTGRNRSEENSQVGEVGLNLKSLESVLLKALQVPFTPLFPSYEDFEAS